MITKKKFLPITLPLRIMLLTQNLTLLLIRTSTVDPLLRVKFIPLTGDLLFINRVHPCRGYYYYNYYYYNYYYYNYYYLSLLSNITKKYI